MDEDDKRELRRDFDAAVNMTPKALEAWLATDESREVGFTRDGEDEAVGHKSGRRIVEILRKRNADLVAADYAHMQQVLGYVSRHLAQGGPETDKADSPWRRSLMNWGHDPLK